MKAADHIVIVDDQPEICELVYNYLTGEGYRVSTANDGPSMRRLMQQYEVDLVLLDIQLPGDDGLSLARQLRAVSDIGIIILTGRGEDGPTASSASRWVPTITCRSPFHLRELLARVKSVLRRASARSDAHKAPPQSAVFKRLEARSHLARAEGAPRARSAADDRRVRPARRLRRQRPTRLLSRDRLLDLARNRASGPFDRTIDVQVGPPCAEAGR